MVAMDPLKIEKVQAMKRYKRGTQQQSFVNYTLTTLILVLFVFSPVWVPEILTLLKLFLLETLPKMVTFLFGPKFFFVICNVIVLFLVGESKFSRAPSVRDLYEEEVRSNLSCNYKKPCNAQVNTYVVEEERDLGDKESNCVGDVREEKDLNELHKKVEEYIARVKWQRKAEAKMFLCY